MNWHDEFRDILTVGKELAPLTTYRIGGRALLFFEPRDVDETTRLVELLAKEGLSFRTLGAGANLLIDDADHEEPIIHIGRQKAVRALDSGGTFLEVEAGASLPRLAADTARDGLAGLDGLAGIPAQVGGACWMNAGGRWGEFGNVVAAVQMVDERGEVGEFDHEGAGFGYRRTNLPAGVVTRVRLRLERAAVPDEPRRRYAQILKEKGAVQPLQEPSGGCVFVNPDGESAGKIVEKLGLKGLAAGGAQVSERHGNFIVNKGNARFADVLTLIETIEARVVEVLGVRLKREIKIWRAGFLPRAARGK